MIKNYRKIGATRASYISGLGSGKSQGGELNVIVKEDIKFSIVDRIFMNESVNINIVEGIIKE